MLLSDAITRVTKYLSFDLDSFQGDTPTQAQSIDVLNWAMRLVARDLFLVDNAIVFNVVAGQADYRLDDPTLFTGIANRGVRILRPYFVIVAGRPLLDPSSRKGLWTMEDIDLTYSDWRGIADGPPLRAIPLAGLQYLRLNPAPDADTVAVGKHFIAGQYCPKDMASDNTELAFALPIHLEAHEAICYLAAVKHAEPMISEAESWQRLKSFSASSMDAIDKLRGPAYNLQAYDGSQMPHRRFIHL